MSEEKTEELCEHKQPKDTCFVCRCAQALEKIARDPWYRKKPEKPDGYGGK